jgi:hypothetical protein
MSLEVSAGGLAALLWSCAKLTNEKDILIFVQREKQFVQRDLSKPVQYPTDYHITITLLSSSLASNEATTNEGGFSTGHPSKY